MEGNIFMQGLPLSELMESLRVLIREELQQSISTAGKEEVLLSPKETTKMFIPKISIVTLHSWTKKGLLQAHYLGGRKYYKRSEILEKLKTLKPYAKSAINH